jgi:putative oxidoreductase
MNTMTRFLVRATDVFQDALLLLVRGYWGYQFALTGYGKLANLERVAGYFGSLGIPAPKLNAIMAGSTECFGGALLALGLFARPSSVALSSTMIVAYLTAHKEELGKIFTKPEAFTGADPFLFLYASLLVLACGPGLFSLDALAAWLGRARLAAWPGVARLWLGHHLANRILDIPPDKVS